MRSLTKELETSRSKIDDAKRIETVCLRTAEDAKREAQEAAAALRACKAELDEAKAARVAAVRSKDEADKAVAAEKKLVCRRARVCMCACV